MFNVDLSRICEHSISTNETIPILYTVHLIYSEMNQEQEIKHQAYQPFHCHVYNAINVGCQQHVNIRIYSRLYA